jgi:hypothetical protein
MTKPFKQQIEEMNIEGLPKKNIKIISMEDVLKLTDNLIKQIEGIKVPYGEGCENCFVIHDFREAVLKILKGEGD